MSKVRSSPKLRTVETAALQQERQLGRAGSFSALSGHIDYLPQVPHGSFHLTREPSGNFLLPDAAVGRSARFRDEIVAVPSVVSNRSLDHAASPIALHEQAQEFGELFYEKEKSSAQMRGPLSMVTGIFNCLSRNREKSGSLQHSLRHRITSSAAAALFEQNRLQQEALVETQDTRDMWEWQMEQQRVITCQEHDLLERNNMEINPLHGIFPDLMRNSSARQSPGLGILSEVAPTTVVQDERLAMEGSPEVKSRNSPSSSGSPSSDLCSRLSNIWHDPELVSAMMLLVESALLRCRSEVNFFCRVYMQQMVFSGYALIRTLMEMEPNTVFLKKVHASYALESRINNALFRCFENDSFDDSGLTQIFDPSARALARLQDYLRMRSVDPEEALRIHAPSYEPAFHAFCANKSEEVMAMFSWNMGYRSAAERDRFMEAFLRAAKWVWLLHRLANATNPPMQIVRVGRGQEVDPMYVEAVAVPPIGSCESCAVTSMPKVEFMIMPGFLAHRKVFRCKVYQHYMCK